MQPNKMWKSALSSAILFCAVNATAQTMSFSGTRPQSSGTSCCVDRNGNGGAPVIAWGLRRRGS